MPSQDGLNGLLLSPDTHRLGEAEAGEGRATPGLVCLDAAKAYTQATPSSFSSGWEEKELPDLDCTGCEE